MARSTTGTPVPGAKAQFNGKYVWVDDWYNPGSEEDCQLDASLKLKGWHKVEVSPENDPQIAMNDKDALDLTHLKYYKEVPIVDHSENTEQMEIDKSELGNALSTKPEEGQISSLSGIA